MLRRYSAKIAYEVELHGPDADLERMPERYSALLGEHYYNDWMGHFDNHLALLKLATLCLAVFIAARFRGVFKTLFICLGFFIAMTFFVGA